MNDTPATLSFMLVPDTLSAIGWMAVAVLLGTVVILAVTVWRLETARRRLEGEVAAWTVLSDGDPGPRVLTSREGVVLAANSTARFSWGETSPVPLLGQKISTEVEGAYTAYERLCSAAEAGLAERVELALATELGGMEWWRVAVRPIIGMQGEPVAEVWTAEDITARRAIDDILVREREELAEFLYLAPVGIYSVDADGSFHFANERFCEWLGTAPAALLGTTIDTILADDLAPEMEGAWQGRLTFRSAQGGTFEATVLQSTFDDAGETRTRSVVIRDENDHALAGDGVCDGEDRRFRGLFEGAPFGICQIDLDGTIVECNPAFARMADEERADLIDQPLHAVLAVDDRYDLDALLHAAAMAASSTAPAIHREVRLAQTPDSVATLSIVPMGEGAADGLMAFFLDTTAQRTLEMQFAQAQKMQAMGQLAGGIAHDFNNLLTAMIGFCDLLLQRHGPGDPSFSDIMQIKQNSNRAANLVRQLLAFSRKQPLKPRLLDVTDALTELSHLLRRLLGETVSLDIKHGRELGLVRVDPGQFDQVIINLAVNARDAMKGQGRLSVRTRAETVPTPFTRGAEQVPAGDYVVISVTDTGTGIPRENLGRIFEPFFSTKTGEVGAGTGLGLSTVYGIIRQTGGFVFVESTVGAGTEFTIYLPRQEASVNEDAPPSNVDGARQSSDSSADLTGGGTLLLVEDEDPVRVFAARALRNKGYQVIEAINGERALETLAEHPSIDLLITDMVMPGMDGATLARTVRRERPNLPVVLISGYSEEAARGDLAESVDFHFLPKPFSLTQLAAKVKALLSVRTDQPTEKQ